MADNILGYLNPDLLAAQRRQALAQMLLQKGSQAPDQKNPYSGLTDAGNMLLGAYLLKKSDQDMSSAYGNMFNGGGPSQNAPPSPPAAPTQAMAHGGDMFAMPNSSAPMAPVPGSAPAPAQSFSPSGPAAPPPGGGQPAQGGEGRAPIDGYLDQVIPQMPGMPPMARMERWNIANNPDQYKVYLDNYMKYYQPTDAMKQAGAALPGGLQDPRMPIVMGAILKKSLQTPVGAGGNLVGPDGVPTFSSLTRQGYTQNYDPQTGQMYQTLDPRSRAAVAQNAMAAKVGANVGTPATVFDPHAPAGQQFPTANANTAAAVPDPVLASLGLAPPSAAGGPTPVQGGAQPGGGAPPAPHYQSQPGLGASDYAKTTAGGLGNTAASTRDMAADAPLRLNILDNIVKLAPLAKTGSSEWLTGARAEAASIAQMFGDKIDANDPAAAQSEIIKFMNQYSLRMSQTLGGGATDAARELVAHASPNDEMFPATLARVVPFLKATESATMAKANMQDALNPSNSPEGQAHVENVWRNNFSLPVAQFSMMSRQQKLGYLMDKRVFNTPSKLDAFRQKWQTLAPYFQQSAPQ